MVEEEKIRLGNLARSARELMTEHGMSAAEAGAFLRPLKLLTADLFQPNPRRYSMAAFVCSQPPDVFRVAHEIKEQLVARSGLVFFVDRVPSVDRLLHPDQVPFLDRLEQDLSDV